MDVEFALTMQSLYGLIDMDQKNRRMENVSQRSLICTDLKELREILRTSLLR